MLGLRATDCARTLYVSRSLPESLSGTVEGFPVLSASSVSCPFVRCCVVGTSDDRSESTSFEEIGVQVDVMAPMILTGTACFLFGIFLGFVGGWVVGSHPNNHECDDDEYEDDEEY